LTRHVAEHEIGWIEEDLRHCAAVDVHFLILVSTDLDLEHYGRKEARHRCRGDENLAEQIECAWIAAGGDGGHVPDHRLSGVQVGRADEQESALAVLLGNSRESLWGNVTRYQLQQWPRVGQPIVEECREKSPLF